MKKAFAVLSALVAILSARAVTVSNVMLSYDAATEKMTVSYHVDAPAIVTLSASLAGEPLAPAQIDALTALANRRVAAGANAVVWDLRATFPEQRIVAAQLKVAVTAWPVDNGPNYMSIDLVNASTVRYYESVDALPEPISSDRWRTTEMLFRKIPAKNVVWKMGSPTGEVGQNTSGSFERQHWVKLTRNYYIGVFECTQKQWALVYGSNANHSDFTGGGSAVADTRPVDKVYFTELNNYNHGLRDNNWPGADEESAHEITTEATFIYKMRALSGLGLYLDLPTEAQWEFACRAGTGTALPNGMNVSADSVEVNNYAYSFVAADAGLDEIARYRMNSGAANGVTAGASVTTAEQGTARVGSYASNDWGLYDMIGNVSEWCLDFLMAYEANTKDAPDVDPRGAAGSNINSKVLRGGSWCLPDIRYGLRAASKAGYSTVRDYGRGFRMCLTLKEGN